MISEYASFSASVDYDTILYPNFGNFPCATLKNSSTTLEQSV